MIFEHILDAIPKSEYPRYQISYVDVEWDDAFKKIHKTKLSNGMEIGIKLGDYILKRGLRTGDVLYKDNSEAVIVRIMPCKVLSIICNPKDAHTIAKLCYEIGNRHAALFAGDRDAEFFTPYNPQMLELLSKISGITIKTLETVLDFDRRISASIHKHEH